MLLVCFIPLLSNDGKFTWKSKKNDRQKFPKKFIVFIENFTYLALHHVRRCESVNGAKTVEAAMVSSLLDYRNSIFYGISSSNLNRLQRVQNGFARDAMATRRCDASHQCSLTFANFLSPTGSTSRLHYWHSPLTSQATFLIYFIRHVN